jgi:hypothetical protein
MYLEYLNMTNRVFPKDGVMFKTKAGESAIMAFDKEGNISVSTPKAYFKFDSLDDFKRSDYFDDTVRKLCELFPIMFHNYDDLIEAGNYDYRLLKENEHGFTKKYKDEILDLYIEFETVFKTNYGGHMKMSFNSITGQSRIETDYSEYEGPFNDVNFMSSNEYVDTVSFDEIDKSVTTMSKVDDGWIINGEYFCSVRDFFNKIDITDGIDIDFGDPDETLDDILNKTDDFDDLENTENMENMEKRK